jgi:hypothetical protein
LAARCKGPPGVVARRLRIDDSGIMSQSGEREDWIPDQVRNDTKGKEDRSFQNDRWKARGVVLEDSERSEENEESQGGVATGYVVRNSPPPDPSSSPLEASGMTRSEKGTWIPDQVRNDKSLRRLELKYLH